MITFSSRPAGSNQVYQGATLRDLRKIDNDIRSMANTLRDVAREAGLSIAAVGRALGKYGSVSDEAHKRALKAARKIGYEPNMVARSLRKKTTRQIGIIIPDIRNPNFTDAVRGVEDAAIEHGYSLMLCNSDENKDKENLYLYGLCARRIDGMIICPTEGTHNKYLTKKIEENFPVVTARTGQ